MDEGNTQDFADDKLCFYDSKNDEEHGLDMLYDNALDDGPMLIDNPPCLVVTTYVRIKMIYLLLVMILSLMRVLFYS